MHVPVVHRRYGRLYVQFLKYQASRLEIPTLAILVELKGHDTRPNLVHDLSDLGELSRGFRHLYPPFRARGGSLAHSRQKRLYIIWIVIT